MGLVSLQSVLGLGTTVLIPILLIGSVRCSRDECAIQLTFTRASVSPIRSARFFLKSVFGFGNLENSSSSCVTCSWVRRGRVEVSISSIVSFGDPIVTEAEHWWLAVAGSKGQSIGAWSGNDLCRADNDGLDLLSL